MSRCPCGSRFPTNPALLSVRTARELISCLPPKETKVENHPFSVAHPDSAPALLIQRGSVPADGVRHNPGRPFWVTTLLRKRLFYELPREEPHHFLFWVVYYMCSTRQRQFFGRRFLEYEIGTYSEFQRGRRNGACDSNADGAERGF